MTNTIKDYILPVFSEEDDSTFRGTAFCINNYIITAGHVAPYYRIYVTKSEGSFFHLDPFIKGSLPFINKDSIDLTAYKIKNLLSPLSLADNIPDTETTLKLIFWQERDNIPTQEECDCYVTSYDSENKLLEVVTSKKITHGSSGCPAIANGKVYGMLIKGVDSLKISKDFSDLKNFSEQDKNLFYLRQLHTCRIIPATEIRKALSLTD